MKPPAGFVAPAVLEEQAYLRERVDPRPGDEMYLHLSDLRLALIDAIATAPNERVFDYGCGGSPYRAFFPTRHYHRADIPGIPNLDFVFGEDSRVAAADAGYDLVLSTQVLEHVKHVDVYLRECRRLLQPGGRLILTTHGFFHEHGCPYDFWRWTADGLQIAIESAGLAVERIEKLTTGPRALVFLNQIFHSRLVVKKKSIASLFLRLSRFVHTRLRRDRLNRLCDEEYPGNRRAPAAVPGHELYVALLAIARRPLT